MFLFLVNILTSNLIIWWFIFLMSTIAFMFMNKNVSKSSLINYFVIQEVCGLLFLLFNFGVFQFIMVLIKSGISPFHFWGFSIINDLVSKSIVWFVTLQKSPFVPVIYHLFDSTFIYLLVFGLIVCYFQLFFIKSYKSMLFISSVESFGWIVLVVFFSMFSGLIWLLMYLIFMFFLLDHSNSKDIDYYNWETIFIFMNIPFSISFFVKFFSLFHVLDFGFIFLILLLILMSLSVLSLSFWLVNMSSKFYFSGFLNFNSFYFICFPLMFMFLIL